MKISDIVYAGFLACSATASIVHSRLGSRDNPTLTERDVATITNVLGDVGSGIDDLDSAVQSYDGSDSTAVVDASKALLSTIQGGKTTVDGSGDLTLADALGLQSPVKDLTDKARNLSDNLQGKKDAIQGAGECSTTRKLVTDINEASKDLINAVISKVPSDAQPIAEGLASDLRKVLDDLQSAFSETGCVDSGNEGGSSTESSPEPTPEPTGEPTAQPSQSATGSPGTTPTNSAIEPPGNSTTTEIGPVPTAGASAMGVPLGLAALVLAAAAF